MDGSHIAVIDVGTVSTRLLIAEVCGVDVHPIYRDATITRLGQEFGESRQLVPKIIEQTHQVIAGYQRIIEEYHRHTPLLGTVCICTAAMRNAPNAQLFIEPLERMGLSPQVIPGEIEARLAFLGVATAFRNQSLLVADVGGGSTELVSGKLSVTDDEAALSFEAVRSFDVGCALVESLMPADPPAANDMDAVRGMIVQTIQTFFDVDYERPERLVLTAGTATTLSAIKQELEPYDPERVHGSLMSGGDIAHIIEELSHLTYMQRKNVKGLQDMRSRLIVPGSLIIEMLMALAGFDSAVVSESDLMTGVAILAVQHIRGENLLLAWEATHSVVCS